MAFQIRYHPDVWARDLRRLDPPLQKEILSQIGKKLKEHPEEFGRPLQHELKGRWRLRVGNYCVIYELDRRRETVWVLMVDQRKDDIVYQNALKRLALTAGSD